MIEAEVAKDYVLKQLQRNKEFRLRLSELFIGKPLDVDAEYLLIAMKVEWPNMSPEKKFSLAQAVAGTNHYNAFIQAMEN